MAGGRGRHALAGEEGWWRPFPVEYKRGRPKPDPCDEVQLCAQALCLEEMFGASSGGGALFYGTRAAAKRSCGSTGNAVETEDWRGACTSCIRRGDAAGRVFEEVRQLFVERAVPAARHVETGYRCALPGGRIRDEEGEA